MERLKKDDPHSRIWVTFFSPSGYEIKKNDPIADVVTYLPLDTPRAMRKFVEMVNPAAVFFIKYEYWYNLMSILSEKSIPFYYISAIFRPQQLFFRKMGGWFAKQLRLASFFFVQNEASQSLLRQIGIDCVRVTGDTRFDRVHAIAAQQTELPFVKEFKSESKLIVAGSSWAPDEKILAPLLKELKRCAFNYKMIVAPHEIKESRIEDLRNDFKDFKTIRYTEMDGKSLADADVLIMDQIGMLSKIYKYAEISYVGGAFETGLHNILEPAVYGVPLFFGPTYAKFNEAVALVELGGAFPITESKELFVKISSFEEDKEKYDKVCEITAGYVEKNLGAVEKIARELRIEN